MGLRGRLRRLEHHVGPPPAPPPELTLEEWTRRLESWLGG